jgi:hypothetical protein
MCAREPPGVATAASRLGSISARGTAVDRAQLGDLMSDADRPEFSVWVFWPDRHDPVLRFISIAEALTVTRRVIAEVGLVTGSSGTRAEPEKVIITDGGDHTVFEWRPKEGAVWPRPVPGESGMPETDLLRSIIERSVRQAIESRDLREVERHVADDILEQLRRAHLKIAPISEPPRNDDD